VAVILFEGGLNLEISRLRRSQAPIRRLVTWGALVTLAGAAAAAHALLGWTWGQATLFGSLVVVTGPTVVGPLIGNLRLRPRVATVLEAEGVMIDPIGAILAVLLLEFTLAPGAESLASGAIFLVARIGFGSVVGIAAGFAITGLLRVKRLVPEGHENITVLASILLLSKGCDEFVPHSGILAVMVAGIVVGNLPTSVDRDLREFKDQLSVMLIGLLFILLAADVRLDDVERLGVRGLAVVAVLIVVVRPVNVWLATLGSNLHWRERALVGWLAPRGIVAAALASVTAAALAREDIAGGPELRALVFLTIAGTVVLAGISAGPAATLLRQRLPGREFVAILGARGLGFLLGRELREAGASVIFLDSNPSCRRAEEAGFPVVFGDALQERTLARARFELVGDVAGVTSNQMLNGVVVSRTRERFNVPRGYVCVARPKSGLAPELVESEEVAVLFDGPHDAARWEVRERHAEVEVEHWVYGGSGDGEQRPEDDAEQPPSAGESFVILMLRRDQKALLMRAGMKLEPGDVAAVAVHAVEREEAHIALAGAGWSPQTAEAPAEA
jgi:NhaP-type Na+/H+ or K+/H+ antiporter